MANLTVGLISGLIFGVVTVAMMVPMQFPDKTTALLAAFFSRFGIGLVIGCVQFAVAWLDNWGRFRAAPKRAQRDDHEGLRSDYPGRLCRRPAHWWDPPRLEID
jgi:hypothetical protein